LIVLAYFIILVPIQYNYIKLLKEKQTHKKRVYRLGSFSYFTNKKKRAVGYISITIHVTV
ncbi:hypothetical protein PDJ90_08540, partial [Bacillus cereus]|nr:hypothetical protein [Bacillus cereus]